MLNLPVNVAVNLPVGGAVGGGVAAAATTDAASPVEAGAAAGADASKSFSALLLKLLGHAAADAGVPTSGAGDNADAQVCLASDAAQTPVLDGAADDKTVENKQGARSARAEVDKKTPHLDPLAAFWAALLPIETPPPALGDGQPTPVPLSGDVSAPQIAVATPNVATPQLPTFNLPTATVGDANQPAPATATATAAPIQNTPSNVATISTPTPFSVPIETVAALAPAPLPAEPAAKTFTSGASGKDLTAAPKDASATPTAAPLQVNVSQAAPAQAPAPQALPATPDAPQQPAPRLPHATAISGAVQQPQAAPNETPVAVSAAAPKQDGGAFDLNLTASNEGAPVKRAALSDAADSTQPNSAVFALAHADASHASKAAHAVRSSGGTIDYGDGIRLHVTHEENNGISIDLEPAGLGKISLSVRPEGNGVNVTVHADRADLPDMMRREGPALERHLRDMGLNLNNGGLQFEHRNSGGEQQRPQPASDALAELRALRFEDAAANPTPQAPSVFAGSARVRNLDIRL